MVKSQFLGRNLARMKLGKDYISMISFMITAVSTFSIYLNLNIYLFVSLIVFALFFGWLLGYIVEKKGILSAERMTLQKANLRVSKYIWSEIWKDVFHEKIKEINNENLINLFRLYNRDNNRDYLN